MTTERTDTLFDVAKAPPVGVVPQRMYAQTIRQARFAEPAKGFEREVVDVPQIGPTEVLVYVMAAGINYNNVWASLGSPVDVVRAHKQNGTAGDDPGFHIGGSDASGIVYAIGDAVTNVKVGDEVVMHCGMWDPRDEAPGRDPALSNSFKIWGYDSNWGSFAQFTKVQAHQCLPKPANLTWEQAAAYMLVGATAYRMLASWVPHTVQPDDVVLVWGGSGGLGCMGIQVAKALGGIPIAVVSNDERGEYCMSIGAKGYIDRTKFDHWGRLPNWTDDKEMTDHVMGFRAFGKAIWDVLGERRSPRIILEHPGEDTIPTSIFTCDTGGMVVICAGTTGYNGDVDLRYLWTRQKRFQGSHFANDSEAKAVNDLVAAGKIDPCLSRTFAFDEVGLAHQLLYENKHPNGNMAILVGAASEGLKIFNTSGSVDLGMTNFRYFEPGDVVVLRNVETPESLQMVHAVLGDPAGTAGQYPFLIGGKIVTVGARPYRVVSDTAEATVLFQPEGTLMPRWQIEEKRYLDDPQRSRGESLRFIFPDRWFDVTLFFETDNEPPWFFDALFRGGGLQAGWRERRADWGSLEPDPTAAKDTNERFRGWYCNVQAPYWRRPYGFDFADLTLDVVVRADRRWYWKDVDELETAIAKGACPEALATHIRASGQEVVKLIESASGPSDESWTRWRAPEDWAIDAFPDGWQHFSPMADMPAFGRPSVNP